MNKLVLGFIVSLALLVTSAHAHRFSTSFVSLETGHDHPQEFDWRWRIVEHDLAVLAPFLVGRDNRLLPLAELDPKQDDFGDFVRGHLAFNGECPVEVLPAIHITKDVYAGQAVVEIYGHGGCPLATLKKIQVSDVFQKIKDHKVVIEIAGSDKREVLSEAQANWRKD